MQRIALALSPGWLRLLLASIVAGLILLWPYPAILGSFTIDDADALHQAWTIRWVQHALASGEHVFAAPTNYPYTQSLVLSQPLYTSAILGMPLYLLGWSPVAVHNALLVLNFMLACWAMALLGRELTGSAMAGLLAGLLYAYADVRFAHIGHLNVLSGFWLPLLLALLLRLWRGQPSSRAGRVVAVVAAGALALAQALADVYNGVYMVVAVLLLALYQLVTRRWGLSWRLTLGLAASGLAAALLALPIVRPTLSAWDDLGIVRQFSDHEKYGARLKNYLVPARPSLLGYDLSPFHEPVYASGGPEFTLWPGLLTLGLALLGLLVWVLSWRLARGAGRAAAEGSADGRSPPIGARPGSLPEHPPAPAARLATGRPQAQRYQPYLILLALLAFFFSLGPTIRLGEADPGTVSPAYRWLYAHVELFAALRVATRWALLVQLALAGLAAYGFAVLLRLAGQGSSRLARVGLALLPLLVAGLCLADLWRSPPRPESAIVGQPLPEVYTALRTLPPGPLLELPMENDLQILAHGYEYYSIFHGHTLVNSASSVMPPRYEQLRAFLGAFPDEASLSLLRDLGVRYINMNRWDMSGWGAIKARLDALPGLSPIGVYEGDRHFLYEILPGAPALPAPAASLDVSKQAVRLVLQLAAPLWIEAPAQLYQGERLRALRWLDAQGREIQASLLLPPVLLPGTHLLPLPPELGLPTALLLPNQALPIAQPLDPASLADQVVPGPQLVVEPLPASLRPGSILSCRMYGKGPLPRQDLIVSLALISADWQSYSKQDLPFSQGWLSPDQWRSDSFAPAPCELKLPADIPAGNYFLVVGLYHPASDTFVPFSGPDGQLVEATWRIPMPISVARP